MMIYKAGHVSLTSSRPAVNYIARHKKKVNNSGMGVVFRWEHWLITHEALGSNLIHPTIHMYTCKCVYTQMNVHTLLNFKRDVRKEGGGAKGLSSFHPIKHLLWIISAKYQEIVLYILSPDSRTSQQYRRNLEKSFNVWKPSKCFLQLVRALTRLLLTVSKYEQHEFWNFSL